MPFAAEWPSGLGKGLQSPVHGFDSRLRLPGRPSERRRARPSGDDDDREIVVPLLAAAAQAVRCQLTDWDDRDLAAFGQLVSRFNQSTSRV
jgi:hypothetical protein